jgi:drug/metabolite transporter (DMT)-like permease
MANSPTQTNHTDKKAASAASIAFAFACVYFFWGSTYTAIRFGTAYMPANLLSGTRFLIAGAILLAWCRWRGLRLLWPPRTMLTLGLIGFFLLSVSNVCLVYASKPHGTTSIC